MNRIHFLAAELFTYSFENYKNHLGIGHTRFEEIMPEFAEQLELAVKEGWSNSKISRTLEIDESEIPLWKKSLQQALALVDAKTPVQSFRTGVTYSIVHALEEGLSTPEEIEALATQICYRVSDLSVMLDEREQQLSMYSDELRQESSGSA